MVFPRHRHAGVRLRAVRRRRAEAARADGGRAEGRAGRLRRCQALPGRRPERHRRARGPGHLARDLALRPRLRGGRPRQRQWRDGDDRVPPTAQGTHRRRHAPAAAIQHPHDHHRGVPGHRRLRHRPRRPAPTRPDRDEPRRRRKRLARGLAVHPQLRAPVQPDGGLGGRGGHGGGRPGAGRRRVVLPQQAIPPRRRRHDRRAARRGAGGLAGHRGRLAGLPLRLRHARQLPRGRAQVQPARGRRLGVRDGLPG